jgi:hypothetical protein
VDVRAQSRAGTFRDAVFDVWFPALLSLTSLWLLGFPGLAFSQFREAMLTYTLRGDKSLGWSEIAASLLAMAVFATTLAAWSTRLTRKDATDDSEAPPLGMSVMAFAIGMGPIVGFCLCTFNIARLGELDGATKMMAAWLTAAAAAVGVLSQYLYVRLHRQKGIGSLREALLATPFALFAVFLLVFGFTTRSQTFDGVTVARYIGPVALFGFGLSFIAAAGSALLLLGRRTRVPFFAILAAWVLLLNYLDVNDNHQIAQVPSKNGISLQIDSVFDRWSALHPTASKRPEPIILVAAEGGGIRAAYVTGITLAAIADKCPAAANRLFAISGVSGGSVGAAAYTAAVQTHPFNPNDRRCDFADRQHTYYEDGIRGIFRADHLSPLLGKLLFSEVAQSIIPFPVAAFDRQHGLDDSLKRDFNAAFGNDDIESPMLQIVPSRQSPSTPFILMNMTSVENGRRVTAGAMHITGHAEDVDSLDPFETDYPLLDVATTSARFPLVSPPGWLTSLHRKIRYIDGGLYDNSGLLTAVGIYEELVSMRDGRDDYSRDTNLPSDAPIIVLNITNAPTCGEEVNHPRFALRPSPRSTVLAPHRGSH